jgi:hypothetical protein
MRQTTLEVHVAPATVALDIAQPQVVIDPTGGLTVDLGAITGPRGPEGPPGAGDYLFHDQTTPTASITVTHNFGRRPAVAVLVDGVEVISDVEHVSDDAVSFVFPTPTAFQAVLTA